MSNNQHILIVEDDIDISEMLCDFFQAQGYEAEAVIWGEDALKLAEARRPDLVLLDIRLPDLNGFEVCRRLRSRRRTAEVPIIFLTELWGRADRITGLELGAIDYVTKPFDFQELRLRVQNALHRAELKSPVNPVTGLATGDTVDERLSELLQREEWSLLSVSICGLHSFNNRYGFVAGDKVLQAAARVLEDIAAELEGENPFVGHLGESDFLLISHPTRVNELKDRIVTQLGWTVDYLRPIRYRVPKGDETSSLSLAVSIVNATNGSYQSALALKRAVFQEQTLA